MFKASKPQPSSCFSSLAAVAAGCDKAQLLAPTQSTITVSAPDARAPEQRHHAGHRVGAGAGRHAGAERHDRSLHHHPGTRRSGRSADDATASRSRHSSPGRTPGSPRSARTRARPRAAPAGRSGTTRDGQRGTITIGAAAVNTVTVRANPGSVGPNGGTVELIASVVGEERPAARRRAGDVQCRPGVAGLDDRHDEFERRGAHDAHHQPADGRDRHRRDEDQHQRHDRRASRPDRDDHLCAGGRHGGNCAAMQASTQTTPRRCSSRSRSRPAAARCARRRSTSATAPRRASGTSPAAPRP